MIMSISQHAFSMTMSISTRHAMIMSIHNSKHGEGGDSFAPRPQEATLQGASALVRSHQSHLTYL